MGSGVTMLLLLEAEPASDTETSSSIVVWAISLIARSGN